ncbi:peptidoglycan-binding protein [Solirubrobacter ginsenosidimutans]|uniref:Peptidoglycan-binding protein n=1 Tax=Solirubrobacter ginsenosidimutans TaxID=490573 RepID=A0A9X3MSS9_9ACTN|nr:peptidoglycan-binding domain-containing protein [Solirubrobacter ginsenosidimutans]MDA0159008.1 peptidoglycan-binding protein [Solirubrobacter ginsenosidimutans]
MLNPATHSLTYSPPANRRDRRPRRKALAIAAALAGSLLAPGGAAAAAGGAPALQARTVQEHLVALGYLPAEAVSGVYDRPTLDAVARFQASQGLPVDGVPDERTADALLSAHG